ncbi:Uncharacterised protein [Mycobacteroides abscessus subsp. massiliense]|nr:Uncharacterised protein [Mycobacteroides abscessus subsp. abscessus]SLC86377.1 Uncharacterised protein [Mycobacteroides abscessus subsp. massiliense]
MYCKSFAVCDAATNVIPSSSNGVPPALAAIAPAYPDCHSRLNLSRASSDHFGASGTLGREM